MGATVMTIPRGRAATSTVSLVVAISLLVAPLAHAQPTSKVYRIGYLGSVSATANPRALEAFRQGLRELGWVEGQNIVIEYRWAEGKADRLVDLAAELVRLKMDIIIAGPSTNTVAAKKATVTIPIIMVGVGDPVGQGLIASLARPGGNVTGLSFGVGSDVTGKELELLKEAVPKVRRVAILSNPANSGSALAVSNVKTVARALGMRLQLLAVRGPDEFDGTFGAIAKDRVEALLVVPDPMFLSQRARLADLAATSRLPAAYGYREHVEAGGLISYGPSLPDLWRRAAGYVDRIFKGAKPAELPVEQPTKFELVINLKTAKALGLMIPQSLLLRADEVME